MRHLLIACAIAISASGAYAQPVPRPVPLNVSFDVVARSASPSVAKGTAFIDNQADYDAWFGGSAPTSPAVDFSREAVVAVSLGEVTTTGYSIEIVKIVQTSTPDPAGGLDLPVLSVTFKSSSPAPGAIVGHIVNNPIFVAKFLRPDRLASPNVSFTELAPPLTAWSTLDLKQMSGWGFGQNITIDSTGAATATKQSLGKIGAPVSGQATPDELAALNAAVASADLANDVGTIPGIVPDGTHFVLDTTGADGASYELQGFNGDLGTHQATIGPLLQALNAIATRLLTPSFSTLTYDIQTSFPVGKKKLTVNADGSLQFATQKSLGPVTSKSDHATADELAALNKAFAASNLSSLDGQNLTTKLVPDAPYFTLGATTSGKTISVKGQEAGLGTYQASVGPLLSALDAIVRRLESESTTLSGTILSVDPDTGKVSFMPNKAGPVAAQQLDGGDLAYALSEQVGKYVVLDAKSGKVTGVRALNPSGDQVDVLTGTTVNDDVMTELDPNATVTIKGTAFDDEGNLYYVISSHNDSGASQDGYVWADSLAVGDAFPHPLLLTPSPTPGLNGALGKIGD